MTEYIPPGTRWFDLPTPFPIKRGGELHAARLAFETWGTLDSQCGNAILILTGLSPNAHVAANAANPDPGWWEAMLGPGKPIDTQRWFVICANSLGSCKGSTGPASIDPASGQAYRLGFPELSVEDIANAAQALVASLGITRLAATIGCSMGGMSALAHAVLHPHATRAMINISGAVQSLPFSIAIRSLQREAIRLDPHWNDGRYTDAAYPEQGMRMARKLGVITYRSSLEWSGRFGRVRLDSEQREGEDPFGLEFQVESYLEGHARRFVRQFDPNCYLYLSRSMDWFDLSEYGHGDADAALRTIALERALVVGVETDILFPLQQQQQLADGLRAGGAEVAFAPLPSPQGHDAFLVDIARFGPVVGGFLGSL